MFQFIKELYLTAFVIFFRIMNWSWTPRSNGGISTCAAFSTGPITLIEWAILLGIVTWIGIFNGTKLPEIPKWALIVAFIVLYAANYYPLVFLRHGLAFDRESSHFKKSKKVLLLVASMVLMLAAIAFFAYSVSVYHRFFHIVPAKGS